jgi:hypothetical protein
VRKLMNPLPEPVPAALDDLAEGTDRDAFTVGANESVPFDVPQCGWRPPPTEPDRDRHALGTDTIDVSEFSSSGSKWRRRISSTQAESSSGDIWFMRTIRTAVPRAVVRPDGWSHFHGAR